MFTFNGLTKTITINQIELISGNVTFTIEQLWSEWCDWINLGNLNYSFALRQSGGDIINATQNIGIAMFLNNTGGWRIIPPTGTCKIVCIGSLYGESDDLPLLQNISGQDTTFIIDKSSLTLEVTSELNNYTLDQIADAVWMRTQRQITNTSTLSTDEHTQLMSLTNTPTVDLSGIPQAVWTYSLRNTTSQNELTPETIWSYDTRSLTENSVNVTKVNGTSVNSINDFKTDLSTLSTQIETIPIGVWGYNLRTTTNEITPSDVWNYTGRSLTSSVDINSALTSKINSLINYDDSYIRSSLLNNADKTDIPSVADISNSVWSNISRTLTGTVDLPLSIINKVNSLNNYDDTFLRSSLLDKANTTDIQAISIKLDSKPTLKDIELSSVLAKSAELTVIENIMAGIPELSEIRNEMINVQFGGLEITNNQMIIKDKLNATIAIFDLFDINGLPTMAAVYKRTVHQ
jgi:hypothetical protein